MGNHVLVDLSQTSVLLVESVSLLPQQTADSRELISDIVAFHMELIEGDQALPEFVIDVWLDSAEKLIELGVSCIEYEEYVESQKRKRKPD